MRVTFVGTGEAFDPDLPNTSLLLRGSAASPGALLCDCGYAVPHALWKITRDPELLDAIYITHLHGDHSFGLPALLLWLDEEGRRKPLQLIGGPGVERWLERLLELAYPGSAQRERSFELVPRELAPNDTLMLGGWHLTCARSVHGVRNLSLRVEAGPHSVCYSGDGGPSEATRELYRGATLLVHECYAETDGGKSHAALPELLELAADNEIRQLALLHLSRRQKARIRAAVAASQSSVELVVPVPGDTLLV